MPDGGSVSSLVIRAKKTGVREHPAVFTHVGVLANKSPGKAELPFVPSSDDRDSNSIRSQRELHEGSANRSIYTAVRKPQGKSGFLRIIFFDGEIGPISGIRPRRWATITGKVVRMNGRKGKGSVRLAALN